MQCTVTQVFCIVTMCLAGMLFGCIIGEMQANSLPWLARGAHGLSMIIVLRVLAKWNYVDTLSML
jgi:hypothetical protein